MKTLNTLLETLPQTGHVEWIGLRPAREVAMVGVEQVSVDPSIGLHGDRYAARSGTRQVTLIQAEHLPAIASCVGLASVAPQLLRRNIVIRGINLLALKGKVVCIGNVHLEITGLCHPCSKMETLLGPGGYNAMRGHGGVTARVLAPGVIALGDALRYTSRETECSTT